jgi:hypothetical protein
MTNLAYILSASHSGSTLLAMLLNSHPDICTVGELKATSLGDVNRYRCSCGQLIKECCFWARVSGVMARRGFAFDITDTGTHYSGDGSPYVRRLLRPLHRGPIMEAIRDTALYLSPVWRRRLPDIQRRNVALVESLLEVSGKRLIVDSSKVGLRLKYLVRNPDLDVKVIRLIRDGRAVALTYMEPAVFADATDPERRAGGMGGERKGERLRMAEAAHEWRRSNEEAEHILPQLGPLQWIEVRYEDLCKDPQGTLRRVFECLSVDSTEAAADFRSVEHHVLGNGMRLDAASEIRLDERWTSVLTADDRRVFDHVAGRLNHRYGYE